MRALVVVTGLVAVAIVAYNVGYDDGADGDGGRFGPWWLFGLLLFPLFGLVFFAVLGGLMRLLWLGGPHRHGHWGPRRERMIEWHRRMHEAGDEPAPWY